MTAAGEGGHGLEAQSAENADVRVLADLLFSALNAIYCEELNGRICRMPDGAPGDGTRESKTCANCRRHWECARIALDSYADFRRCVPESAPEPVPAAVSADPDVQQALEAIRGDLYLFATGELDAAKMDGSIRRELVAIESALARHAGKLETAQQKLDAAEGQAESLAALHLRVVLLTEALRELLEACGDTTKDYDRRFMAARNRARAVLAGLTEPQEPTGAARPSEDAGTRGGGQR